MTVMYSFCIWFPVRLGAIIVAISGTVESLACLVAALVGLLNPKNTSEEVDDLMDRYDLIVTTSFFEALKQDPESWLQGFITAMAIHIFSCLLLLIGCFKCNVWLLYPFVGLDFLRLVVLSIVLVILLLVIKSNTMTLGMVIGASIFGGFFMLYLWYQWFCVVSLCQIIREVRQMERSPNPRDAANLSYSRGFNSKIAAVMKPSFLNGQKQAEAYFGLPILN